MTQQAIPKIPRFWLELPMDARISSNDVAKAFGYKNSSSLNTAVSHNLFPKCDYKQSSTITSSGKNRTGRTEWHVSTLIREARRRIEINKKVNEK